MALRLDDDDLHVLLAGNRLSGPQRDRIFERAFEEGAKPHRWRRIAAWSAAAMLPMAAAAALVLQPSRGPVEAAGDGWLVAKGNDAGATATARCPDSPEGKCRIGDRLIFETDGSEAGGYLAAYADCAARERIWYFPTAANELPALPATKAHVVLRQAARIGAEHGPGACTVHLFVLTRALDRKDIAAGRGLSSASIKVPIVITE